MSEKTIKTGKYIWLKYILFALMPLVAGCIYCLISKKSILDIYIPSGTWNDEVSYYKQIEGMIHFGIPRGYFAYNDVNAPVGTMGPWCVLLFFPYVILGKLIGWTYLSPIICNILFVCIGFFLFAFFSRKKGITLLVVGGMYCVCPMMLRYMLSGMIEPLFYMCMLIYAGLILRMWEDDRIRWAVAALALGAYLTIIRPYFVLLMVIPVYHFWVQKRRKGVILSIICLVISLVLYFVINKMFCAPYFIQTIDLTSLNLLKEGHVLKAVGHALSVLGNAFAVVMLYVKKNILSGQVIGEMWSYFFIFCIFLGSNCLTQKKEKRKHFLLFFLLSVMILASVLIFYSPNMGARHMLLMSVFLIAVLAEGKGKNLIVQGILLVIIGIVMPRDTGVYNLPYKTEEGEAYIKEKRDIFAGALDLTEGYSWDNSVMWIMSDVDKNQAVHYVPYNMLYALPEGMGISVTMSQYVLEHRLEGIHSKYILTARRGMVEKMLQEADAVCLAGDDIFSLFLNPRYNDGDSFE